MHQHRQILNWLAERATEEQAAYLLAGLVVRTDKGESTLPDPDITVGIIRAVVSLPGEPSNVEIKDALEAAIERIGFLEDLLKKEREESGAKLFEVSKREADMLRDYDEGRKEVDDLKKANVALLDQVKGMRAGEKVAVPGPVPTIPDVKVSGTVKVG